MLPSGGRFCGEKEEAVQEQMDSFDKSVLLTSVPLVSALETLLSGACTARGCCRPDNGHLWCPYLVIRMSTRTKITNDIATPMSITTAGTLKGAGRCSFGKAKVFGSV